ncbi:MAG TPA: AMP-dependent synthetase/ligase [Candidatus Acidoferrales bacterium]|jgi:long-chain acyl-CoA synthetase|nr:AMP-dependent synthetase/ligase [Candidatus Acidoferrales bacterium]
MNRRTVYRVLEESARLYGDAPALRQPDGAGYVTYSWNQYKQAVEEIALGLRALGLGKGDVVALNSETRLEFYLADLGIMANGSIAAAMYPSYPAKDLVRTIEQAGAKAVFAEDPKTLKTLQDAPVRIWILLTGEAEGALTLQGLRAMGRAAAARDPQWMARLGSELQPSDTAILYLTSGATGEPKMALVTHQAVVANIDMGPAALPIGPADATVAFLPSAHIAQRVVIELLPLRMGMPVTFAGSLLQLPQDIRNVRPTILLAPPRMWERIYSTICTELRKRPAPIRKAFYAALGLGLAAARYRKQGKPVPARIRGPLKVADAIFFRKVRGRFGGRLKIPASGAAPLSKDLAEFYEAIGLPIFEGYGLTEGGVVTLNPLDRPKPGSIGIPLAGVEVKLDADGEILVKSPCLFSGYLNDPQTTAEVLVDGWLHTGDLGHADSDGYFFITGRKKELIVSSTGKKIYPSRVENLFKMEPLISQVLLIGDRLPFLTALFTINPAAAEALKGMDQWQGRPASELAQAPPVLAEIQKAVSRVNKQLAPFEQVRKHRVLARDFSIDQGELTATMKVRRTRTMENFKEAIDEFYDK